MKTRMLILTGIILLGANSLFAQEEKTEEFTVAGNCGMCETRIEKAAGAVGGVSSADWDKETDKLKVTFDPGSTDLHKVHMAVAEAGHDTEMHKASDEAYDKLACHLRICPSEVKPFSGILFQVVQLYAVKGIACFPSLRDTGCFQEGGIQIDLAYRHFALPAGSDLLQGSSPRCHLPA